MDDTRVSSSGVDDSNNTPVPNVPVDQGSVVPTDNQQVAPPTFTPPVDERISPPAQEPDPEAADSYPDDTVSWTASEFITHRKTTSWYLLLGSAMIAIVLIVWFATTDVFATVTVAIGMLLLGIYAGRKPREQRYMLDDSGLTVGERHLWYAEFRSFSVNPEGELTCIEFTPLKRLALYTSVYFNSADEEKIVTVLSSHLPMEEPRNDFTDNLMRRLHF